MLYIHERYYIKIRTQSAQQETKSEKEVGETKKKKRNVAKKHNKYNVQMLQKREKHKSETCIIIGGAQTKKWPLIYHYCTIYEYTYNTINGDIDNRYIIRKR